MYEINRDILFEDLKIKGTRFQLTQNNQICVFPYTTNPGQKIMSVAADLGSIICNFDECEPENTDFEMLYENVRRNISFANDDPELEEAFKDALEKIYYDSESKKFFPLNIRFIEQQYDAKSKLAPFLADVLGDRESVKQSIDESVDSNRSNVLEDYVLSQLGMKQLCVEKNKRYKKITDSLTSLFTEDFKFIVSSAERIREYLCPLIEFYYFMYMMQAFSTLTRFTDGDRNKIRPLFFCLDWEKSSYMRETYEHGWKPLSGISRQLFIHSVTLEILNCCNCSLNDERGIDYIDLAGLAVDEDESIAEEIIRCADLIHEQSNIIFKEEVQLRDDSHLKTGNAIRYLYDMVNALTNNTERFSAANRYGSSFMPTAMSFLKDRGRMGYALNITEDMLILLTKLAIKDNDKLRLNKVFSRFEERGVFFDDISKDNIAQYYEKLNLIEKKSDSGDSKYVRRII